MKDGRYWAANRGVSVWLIAVPDLREDSASQAIRAGCARFALPFEYRFPVRVLGFV
jgi:hypothetical protein